MQKYQSELTGSLLFKRGDALQAAINPGNNSLSITGSLVLSGSTLHVGGSDLVNRVAILESGSGGDSSIGELNVFTGSANTRLTRLEARTSSIDSNTGLISNLTAATSSYISDSDLSNVYSSSAQISASGFLTSESAAALGFGSGGGISSYTDLTNVPVGILSSSAQVQALGFITSSVATSTGSLLTTASANLNVVQFTKGDGSTFSITINTGSSSGGSLNYNSLTNIPEGIISSSAQLPSGIISSSAQISISTSSITNFETEVSRSAAAAGFGSGGSVPGGTISSSAQVIASLPSGVVSSSTQIVDALPSGLLSSSAQVVSALPSNTVSSSAQVSFTGISNVPSGIISSSTQIVSSLPSGVVSSSAQTIANVSGSHLNVAAITASAFVSTAAGTPTLRAANNLILSASNSIQIKGGTLRLPTFTDAQTGSLTLVDGDLIYNTTREKILFYSASTFNEFDSEGTGVTSYSELTGIPSGIISSSEQVSYTGLSNIPANLVSASSQVSYTGLSNIPSGIISSSDQITNSGMGVLEPGSGLFSFPFTFQSSSVAADPASGRIRFNGSNQFQATRFYISQTDGDGRGLEDVFEYFNSAQGTSKGHVRVSPVALPGQASKQYYIFEVTDLVDNGAWWTLTVSNVIWTGFNEFTQGEELIVTFDPSVASLATGVVSGSSQVSYTGLSNIPSGIISSSSQIVSLVPTGSNIVTASAVLNTVTFTKADNSTFDITINTGSSGGGGGVSSYTALSNIPSGIISSSAQTVASINNQHVTSIVLSGSTGVSGSIIPEDDGGGNGIHDLGSVMHPFRDLYLTTSSLNFVLDGELFSSINAEKDAIRIGNILITTSSIGAIDLSDNSVINVIETSNMGMTASLTVPYDGNRTVTNDDAGDFFGTNVGTTGSVVDFLDALFFPNQPPVFTLAANQTAEEFTPSGSTVFTVTATDADGDTVTYDSPNYTGSFLEIASNGVVTLQASASTAWNTNDRGDGTLAHAFPVRASDPNNGSAHRTFYLNITPNSAPKFRSTSVSGTVITTLSQNRIESSGTGDVVTFYITDDESDAITITSPLYSSSNHFDMITSSNSVTIRQQTGSLEFDGGITTYTFNVTASDEHGAQSSLPITINVTDNTAPSFNNQTETGLNENSSAGTVAGQATATDSDSLTFRNFSLAKIQLDGSDIALGTYNGTGQDDPSENPFMMASTGQITRKTGVYLNSDLINNYIYSASVFDGYNNDVYAVITIPVADDAAPSITNNSSEGSDTYYISQTAVSGSTVRTNTNGVGGDQAAFSSNQSVTWDINPDSIFSINSSGNVSVNSHISGAYAGGVDIGGSVTASNSFGTTATQAFTLTTVANSAPSIAFNISSSMDTDFTVNGAHLGTVSITDLENNSPYSLTLNKDVTGSFSISPNNAISSSWSVSAATDLAAADYTLSVTASDSFGTDGTATEPITITEAAVDGLVYLHQTNTNRGGTDIEVYMGISGTDTSYNPVSASLFTTYTNALHAFRDNTTGTGGSGLAASSISGLYGNTTSVFREGELRSGSNLDTVLRQAEYATTNRTGHFILAIASGSDMTGVPTTMRDSFGSNVVGEYVLSMGIDGTYGQEDGKIYQIALDQPHQGFREWIFIVMRNAGGGTAINPRITASSGSAPTN